MAKLLSVLMSLCILQLNIYLNGVTGSSNWLKALPFHRTLRLRTSSPMSGKDVTILQNLLRRHAKISSLLPAGGIFDKKTKEAVAMFQQYEGISPANGVLNVQTGENIINLLMQDKYKVEELPTDCKFFLHVPVHRNRSIETTATLYKCGSSRMYEVLHKFRVRARGSNKRSQHLNQLTSNGDTPTGLSRVDLNTPQQKRFQGIFGPYPILRLTKGIAGNVAIGRDNAKGNDEKRESFLNDYRYGILLHSFINEKWDESMPLPSSLGCLKVSPSDNKKIADVLIKAGVIPNKNTYGRLPYPHKPQGLIAIVET